MTDYWINKKNRLQIDIDHIKRQLVTARETEEITHLKQLKERLTDELMIAIDAIDKLT